MRIIETIVKSLVVASLALTIASCCCTGGVDDNYGNNQGDDTDLNLPGGGGHNQGG